MPEIEITEDQREYLEALQEDIQQDVVGKYAHVRMVDAVQYLIDNHEGEINATVTTPSSGPDVSAENAPVADPVAPTEDGEETADSEEETTDEDAEPEPDDAEGKDGAEADDESDDADAGNTNDSEDESGDEADSGGATSTPPMAAAGGGDDDGMLSAMMALMDTHDDKWEAASGDTGYEVELPDGSSESAATQDDVRAILFKHYE